jgi:hypothetical protein
MNRGNLTGVQYSRRGRMQVQTPIPSCDGL